MQKRDYNWRCLTGESLKKTLEENCNGICISYRNYTDEETITITQHIHKTHETISINCEQTKKKIAIIFGERNHIEYFGMLSGLRFYQERIQRIVESDIPEEIRSKLVCALNRVGEKYVANRN